MTSNFFGNMKITFLIYSQNRLKLKNIKFHYWVNITFIVLYWIIFLVSFTLIMMLSWRITFTYCKSQLSCPVTGYLLGLLWCIQMINSVPLNMVAPRRPNFYVYHQFCHENLAPQVNWSIKRWTLWLGSRER